MAKLTTVLLNFIIVIISFAISYPLTPLQEAPNNTQIQLPKIIKFPFRRNRFPTKTQSERKSELAPPNQHKLLGKQSQLCEIMHCIECEDSKITTCQTCKDGYYLKQLGGKRIECYKTGRPKLIPLFVIIGSTFLGAIIGITIICCLKKKDGFKEDAKSRAGSQSEETQSNLRSMLMPSSGEKSNNQFRNLKSEAYVNNL